MRPDRIIVGEVRGPEAFDMLQAMNTGHPGSLTTVHANSPPDAVRRLESMVLMAGLDLPQPAIREQIASSLDLIVQQERLSGGKRKVVSITEVLYSQEEDWNTFTVSTEEIFRFERDGLNDQGKMMGKFQATGYEPQCLILIKQSGFSIMDKLEH
jgi:pilus assembly protein CpaF